MPIREVKPPPPGQLIARGQRRIAPSPSIGAALKSLGRSDLELVAHALPRAKLAWLMFAQAR